MKKQYKLLIDTADYPQGTIVESEDLETPDEEAIMYIYTAPDKTTHLFKPWQIESRPTVWELINEKVEDGYFHLTPDMLKCNIDCTVKSPINKYLPFFPALSQKYWFISSTGKVESDTVCGHPVDTLRVTNSVVFRTEQGAKYEALRRESMSNRYMPDFEEDYYYYSFNHKRIYNPEWKKAEDDIRNYFIGNVHKTEKDCKQWADKYAKAWEVLL